MMTSCVATIDGGELFGGRPRLRALGFDPGWAHFGYAIADVLLDETTRLEVVPIELGTWSTKPSAKKQRIRQANDDRRRGMELADAIFKLIARRNPSMLCAESPVGSRMARQAGVLGRANGIVDAVAATYELPLLEATPVDLKKAVAGNGKAGKEHVESALRRRYMTGRELFGDTVPDHAWDALGAIVACASTSEVRLMLAAAGVTDRGGGPAHANQDRQGP